LLSRHYLASQAESARLFYVPDQEELKRLASLKSSIDKAIKIREGYLRMHAKGAQAQSVQPQSVITRYHGNRPLDSLLSQIEKNIASGFFSKLRDPDNIYIPDTEKILRHDLKGIYASLMQSVDENLKDITTKGILDKDKLVSNTNIRNKISVILAVKEILKDYQECKNKYLAMDMNDSTHLPYHNLTEVYRGYKSVLGQDEAANYIFLSFNYMIRGVDAQLASKLRSLQKDNIDEIMRYNEDKDHVIALAVLMDKNFPKSNYHIRFNAPDPRLVQAGKQDPELSRLL
jgi:hypothetical protein